MLQISSEIIGMSNLPNQLRNGENKSYFTKSRNFKTLKKFKLHLPKSLQSIRKCCHGCVASHLPLQRSWMTKHPYTSIPQVFEPTVKIVQKYLEIGPNYAKITKKHSHKPHMPSKFHFPVTPGCFPSLPNHFSGSAHLTKRTGVYRTSRCNHY